MTEQYQTYISHICELLHQRFASYPARDASFTRLMDALTDFAEKLRARLNVEAFSPRPEIVQAAAAFADQPLFICGAMKSGTSLLTQLLDHHPDLLVMPGDSHFAHQRQRWTREQFADISTYWLQRLINPSGKEPFWFVGPEREAFEQFLHYLHYFLTRSHHEIFVCVVMAVYAVNAFHSGVAPKRYWVEKTPHNELEVDLLQEAFPQAKFLHIIRDPLENIASLKRLSALRQRPATALEYALSMKHLFQVAQQNQARFGEGAYHLIRYEDLVSAPEQILQGMCQFLAIPFHDILLQPTENGRPAMSNSMFRNARVAGKILNQSRSKRYLEQLSRAEIQDIVTIVFPEAIRLGYAWNTPEIARYNRAAWKQLVRNLYVLFRSKMTNIFTH